MFKAALRERPLSVAFGVADDFFYYSSGVYDGGCSDDVNHGMVAVGYGRDRGSEDEYVIVRNSWGTVWGEEGYVRLPLSAADDSIGGKCQIIESPNYPTFPEMR